MWHSCQRSGRPLGAASQLHSSGRADSADFNHSLHTINDTGTCGDPAVNWQPAPFFGYEYDVNYWSLARFWGDKLLRPCGRFAFEQPVWLRDCGHEDNSTACELWSKCAYFGERTELAVLPCCQAVPTERLADTPCESNCMALNTTTEGIDSCSTGTDDEKSTLHLNSTFHTTSDTALFRPGVTQGSMKDGSVTVAVRLLDSPKFTVGVQVEALYPGVAYFDGVISAVHAGGTRFTIDWADGDPNHPRAPRPGGPAARWRSRDLREQRSGHHRRGLRRGPAQTYVKTVFP